MHKRKDGKIIASLTEVKNKTGDIFSLVDEFGEVTLTSYNKPRYKIIKVNISEVVNIEEKKTTKVVKKTSRSSQSEKKPVKTEVAPVEIPEKPIIQPPNEQPSEPEHEDKKIETNPEPSSDSNIDEVKVWDVNSEKEKALVSELKKPLQ